MARIGVDATHVLPDGKGHALTQRMAVEGLAGEGFDVVAFVRPGGAALLACQSYVVRSPKTALWELVELPLAMRRLGLDAVLTFSERLPLAGGPFVVWLFELPTHRIALNREGGSAYQRASDALTARLWRRGLLRATRICTGSRATQDELLEALPELEGRTRVVYPALPDTFTPGPRTTGPPFVFHLSSADPRDNTEAVLEAYAVAARDDVQLVVGGGLGGRDGVLRRHAAALGLDGDRVLFTGRLSDDDLLARYRSAAAYVDASLFEGFGYQVLEAMACGAPVVASSSTSIPEVVGDAGLLCDPRSPHAIAGALVRLLDEPGLAAELRTRGFARAQSFTWQRSAAGLASALDEALAA